MKFDRGVQRGAKRGQPAKKKYLGRAEAPARGGQPGKNRAQNGRSEQGRKAEGKKPSAKQDKKPMESRDLNREIREYWLKTNSTDKKPEEVKELAKKRMNEEMDDYWQKRAETSKPVQEPADQAS